MQKDEMGKLKSRFHSNKVRSVQPLLKKTVLLLDALAWIDCRHKQSFALTQAPYSSSGEKRRWYMREITARVQMSAFKRFFERKKYFLTQSMPGIDRVYWYSYLWIPELRCQVHAVKTQIKSCFLTRNTTENRKKEILHSNSKFKQITLTPTCRTEKIPSLFHGMSCLHLGLLLSTKGSIKSLDTLVLFYFVIIRPKIKRKHIFIDYTYTC